MILGCLTDRIGRARIEDGAKGVDRVLWLDTFADLLARLSERPTDVTGVVVGWADTRDIPPFNLIGEVRRTFPAVPILGYCPSSAERLSDLRRMAVAGVHELLLDTIADSRTIVRTALQSTRRQASAAQVFAQIQSIVPPDLHQFMLMALESPTRTNSVAALARELGVDRKTLHNWCKAENYPPPRDLLRWARLLLAAALLNWSGRSVTSVALELDFPTDNSLRIAIRRQFRVPPSAMKRGGVDRAVAAFKAYIDQWQKPARSIAVA